MHGPVESSLCRVTSLAGLTLFGGFGAVGVEP
jgi:hypothetical protein